MFRMSFLGQSMFTGYKPLSLEPSRQLLTAGATVVCSTAVCHPLSQGSYGMHAPVLVIKYASVLTVCTSIGDLRPSRFRYSTAPKPCTTYNLLSVVRVLQILQNTKCINKYSWERSILHRRNPVRAPRKKRIGCTGDFGLACSFSLSRKEGRKYSRQPW